MDYIVSIDEDYTTESGKTIEDVIEDALDAEGIPSTIVVTDCR